MPGVAQPLQEPGDQAVDGPGGHQQVAEQDARQDHQQQRQGGHHAVQPGQENHREGRLKGQIGQGGREPQAIKGKLQGRAFKGHGQHRQQQHRGPA